MRRRSTGAKFGLAQRRHRSGNIAPPCVTWTTAPPFVGWIGDLMLTPLVQRGFGALGHGAVMTRQPSAAIVRCHHIVNPMRHRYDSLRQATGQFGVSRRLQCADHHGTAPAAHAGRQLSAPHAAQQRSQQWASLRVVDRSTSPLLQRLGTCTQARTSVNRLLPACRRGRVETELPSATAASCDHCAFIMTARSSAARSNMSAFCSVHHGIKRVVAHRRDRPRSNSTASAFDPATQTSGN